MAFTSLRDFVEKLERDGNLVRVTKPVSTELEMTEIQTRLLSEQGPAVLFENPIRSDGQKSKIPVLLNLFGTISRVAEGMGFSPKELKTFGEELAVLRHPKPPSGWQETLSMLPMVKSVLAMKPKIVKNGICQEIVLTKDKIDLTQLPIQSCWPEEPAPLISWPIVVTKGPAGVNLGIYRMQVTGRKTTLMRWLKHRGGADAHAFAGKLGIPVAAIIGADPATILAAVTPVPESMSEYQFAGLLRKQKVELVDCKTVPLQVPANSEIVIEGHVSGTNFEQEGPYGDHTGYYNSTEKFPVFTITAITMRENPIYLSTFTGRPPDEPSIIGEALNDVFVPLLQLQFPEIVDFWLPPEACSYRIAVVSIRKSYPGHAKRIMMGVWSYLRQFMYTKFIIVIDNDINPKCWKDVVWAISTNVDPGRDFTILENTPIDYLDFSSPESGLGSKVGIDATTKIHPETKRHWGHKIRMRKDIIKKVTDEWVEYRLPGSGKPIWKNETDD